MLQRKAPGDCSEFQAAARAVGPPTVKVSSMVGWVFYLEPCACWLTEELVGGKDCVQRNPWESGPLRQGEPSA